MMILVVDDEPNIELLFRRQFRRDLRARRFDMDFVGSAIQALRRIGTADDRALSLILSDINMPGMSGLDMLPHIRSCLPNVPIIMISAYGDSQTRDTALERSADDLLIKPIDFERLRQEIDARMGGEG